jgi:predicted ATPase
MPDFAHLYNTVPLAISPTKRYILTGTPGSGKTSVINALAARGYSTVQEAATAAIAEAQQNGVAAPWQYPEFIDTIVHLQQQRQRNVSSGLQFYDRSPICSYALARYLGFLPSTCLMNEIERMATESVYEKQVFFLANLGFIVNTEARRISFQDALKFERQHEEAYQEWGYQMIKVPVAPVDERCDQILKEVCRLSR